MKRPKIIFALGIAIIFFVAPATTFSQTEKLDVIRYDPPKGWTKAPKAGVMVYSDSNNSTGAFCIISVYPSTQSAGSPQKDFDSQWNELIARPFNAAITPKTEIQTSDGWTSLSAATQIESNGVRSAVFMTVVSGYGRTASIFAIFNSQSYFSQIDAFMTGIKLDKAAAIADAKQTGAPAPKPVTGNNSDYLDFDPFPDKPFVQPQKPLLGRLRKTITTADLSGKWEIGGASVTSYFNSSSGNYSSTDTSFFGEWYTIRADGSFDSNFQGRTSNHTVREADSGTILLDGGIIIFKFKQKPAKRYQFVAYMEHPNGAAVLTLLYIGDTAPRDAEGLRGNCNHTNGYISCIGGNEWVRLPSRGK